MSKGKCWKSNVEEAREIHGRDSQEYLEALERTSTCMLPNGHAGPHEWTFDGDICFICHPGKDGADIMKYGRKIGEV